MATNGRNTITMTPEVPMVLLSHRCLAAIGSPFDRQWIIIVAIVIIATNAIGVIGAIVTIGVPP
jgi:hypothetical protein